ARADAPRALPLLARGRAALPRDDGFVRTPRRRQPPPPRRPAPKPVGPLASSSACGLRRAGATNAGDPMAGSPAGTGTSERRAQPLGPRLIQAGQDLVERLRGGAAPRVSSRAARARGRRFRTRSGWRG